MELPFSGIIRNIGSSCVVTIPSDYMNLLDEGVSYDFIIKKPDKQEKKEEDIDEINKSQVGGRDF